MQKQSNSMCRHRFEGGCDIYENRPLACRTYFCGWRRLAFFYDDWRPDKSGVLLESGTRTTVGSGSMVLNLVGNPLKTIRRQHFLAFIRESIDHNVTMFLSLPGAWHGESCASLKYSRNAISRCPVPQSSPTGVGGDSSTIE